jgi:hypothetical protein
MTKISEVIEYLNTVMEEHGDLEVVAWAKSPEYGLFPYHLTNTRFKIKEDEEAFPYLHLKDPATKILSFAAAEPLEEDDISIYKMED